MKIYVGITDYDWYTKLRNDQPDEVNFWKPGEIGGFAALEPGGLFLFKLKKKHGDYIVGGAHFVAFSRMTLSMAWECFEQRNGVWDRQQFRERIISLRHTRDVGPDPTIGCIVLNSPFFLDEEDWVKAPADWPTNTVQGKTYDESNPHTLDLWRRILPHLAARSGQVAERQEPILGAQYLANSRLGQGSFRVAVTDAYQRRCAISGERTLPVLEAAHIVPYAKQGESNVRNGLLLRSDIHKLFDSGLITVTPDHVVKVSSRIREQYENGRIYYAFDQQPLLVQPQQEILRPRPEYLERHNQEVFVG